LIVQLANRLCNADKSHIVTYLAPQVRDLVFRMKHTLDEVEKLNKQEAWQLLRGERVDMQDTIDVDDDGVHVNPFMAAMRQDDAAEVDDFDDQKN
jgi:hypothetical protein